MVMTCGSFARAAALFSADAPQLDVVDNKTIPYTFHDRIVGEYAERPNAASFLFGARACLVAQRALMEEVRVWVGILVV